MAFPPEPHVQIQNNFRIIPHDALNQNGTNGTDLLDKRDARVLDKECL